MNEADQSSGLITTVINNQAALDKMMANSKPESPTKVIAAKSTKLFIITLLVTTVGIYIL